MTTDPATPAAPQSQQTSEQTFIRQMFPKRFETPATPAPGAAPGAAPASPGSAVAPGASGAPDPAARPDGASGGAQQEQVGAPAEYAISDEMAKFEIQTDAGVAVRIDPNDARLPDARVAAKELGLSQAEFDKVLKLDARLTAAAVSRANKNIDAAEKALGPTFESERAALVAWGDTHLASPAEAREFLNFFSSGDLPTRFRLMQRLTGLRPGAVHNNNPPSPPRNEQSLVRSLFSKRFGPDGNLLLGGKPK